MPKVNQVPLLYHTHHASRPEDIPFWVSMAFEYGGPILELGCGTGRVLSVLEGAGFRVFGLDNDLQMLHFLRAGFPIERGSPVNIFLANVSAFHLAYNFPLIIMPCNTLSTLSNSTRRACYERIAEHLTGHGVFAAGLPNPLTLRDMPESGQPEWEGTFTHPSSGQPVMVSSAWKKDAGHFQVIWNYDHLTSDGKVERVSIESRHQLLLREEYVKEMAEAGLEEYAAFGSYGCSPYTPSSPDLILMVRKAG